MAQVSVEVLVDDPGEGAVVDPRRRDQLCRQLAQDLRAVGGLAVRPAVAQPPPLAKSGVAEQIGYLVVSGLLSATTVRAVRDVLVAYLARTRARGVTVRNGDREVTITGASAADLNAVTRQLDELIGGPERINGRDGDGGPERPGGRDGDGGSDGPR